MRCPPHSDDRVVIREFPEPDGTVWPRCTSCGHRMPYADSIPEFTRRIALRHPTYIITELRGRRRARKLRTQ